MRERWLHTVNATLKYYSRTEQWELPWDGVAASRWRDCRPSVSTLLFFGMLSKAPQWAIFGKPSPTFNSIFPDHNYSTYAKICTSWLVLICEAPIARAVGPKVKPLSFKWWLCGQDALSDEVVSNLFLHYCKRCHAAIWPQLLATYHPYSHMRIFEIACERAWSCGPAANSGGEIAPAAQLPLS